MNLVEIEKIMWEATGLDTSEQHRHWRVDMAVGQTSRIKLADAQIGRA